MGYVMKSEKPSVLFVCMGNICRSPTAHAVMIKKSQQAGLDVFIDSAGTINSHAGHAPDPRSIKIGTAAGYNFKGLKARPVVIGDFEQFDFILAMDHDNLSDLNSRCPEEHKGKIKLLMEFARHNKDQDQVPDPYYGGTRGFDYVLSLVEDACDGLIEHIQKR